MAFTYAGRYGPEQVIDTRGVPRTNTTVTVYETGTTTLATLYTDRTKATTASNPTTTSALGNLTFFANPGTYDILCSGTTLTVTVPVDPSESESDETAHVAAADPHAVYQLEAAKGVANGYASLDADGKVPAAQLNGATGIWAVPTAGAGSAASPFTHADGSGGIATAITAAAAAGVKSVRVPAGHYSVTTTISGFVNDLTLITDPGVVLVADAALVDGLVLKVEGTSGDYVENVKIGSFHISRVSAGSVRLRYVRNVTVGKITCAGGGGGILSIRDIERCQFAGVIGWNLDANSSGVNAHRMNDCQVAQVITDGGAEAVDIFDSHRNHFAQVAAYSPSNEGVDMGSCSYNTFDEILVRNATTNGVSCKVEDGAVGGGSFRNTFGKVIVIDHTLIGFDIGNGPATPNGTDVQNDNIVESLIVSSTVAGAIGARVQGTASNPLPNRNQFRNVWIKVPEKAIYIYRSISTMVGGGYVESTGTYAVLVDSDGVVERPHIKNLKVVGNPATNTGAILVQNVTDPVIEGCEIISTTGDGIRVANALHARLLDNTITECQFYGITISVPDVAAWRGKVNHEIRRNRIRNIGKGGGTRYGIRLLQVGATAAESILVDDNEVYDTQATKTSNGVLWSGTFDWCSFRRNRIRIGELAGNVTFSGTFGANSVREQNDGLVTENQGAAAGTGDNTNISHGLTTTPTMVVVSGSVAGEIVTVTSIGAASFNVAIKKHDGTSGTSQTVYWRAKYV